MQQIHESLGDRVTILAPSLDAERAPVESFVASKGLTLHVLLDPRGTVAGAYGVRVIPTLVLIDRRGTVRFRHQGYPGTETLTRELEELIAEAGP